LRAAVDEAGVRSGKGAGANFKAKIIRRRARLDLAARIFAQRNFRKANGSEMSS
jgi:hypothetical protein